MHSTSPENELQHNYFSVVDTRDAPTLFSPRIFWMLQGSLQVHSHNYLLIQATFGLLA